MTEREALMHCIKEQKLEEEALLKERREIESKLNTCQSKQRIFQNRLFALENRNH